MKRFVNWGDWPILPFTLPASLPAKLVQSCRRCFWLILLLLAACAQDAPPVSVPETAAAPTAISPTAAETTVPTIAPTETAVPAETPTSYAGKIPAPEFPLGLDWLNTGRPFTLAELRGKVVLLDFWTYGCINCMHVIPDLKRLEEKYAEELVVIGVHSAKFTTEQETDNIRQVILRYDVTHPVVNDRDFLVWNSYGVNAWPTFVLIDPVGNVLGYHAGEGIYELFDGVIGGMVAEFDAAGLVDRTPLALQPEQANQLRSPLRFPGKVLADADGNRLFIADSSHNRIVVTDLAGVVQAVIGNGRPALSDGSYETAAFHGPQGMTLADANTLYVADTRNHAIRRVDLAAQLVETVAGTGAQGAINAVGGRGVETALNSPWDVLAVDGHIYIAMAGQHQLWVYDPQFGGVQRFAGTGREALADGLLLAGSLNQPSGLASDGARLYFADSEASAIRYAELGENGRLHTIVGTGLFDFGDVDGVGDVVRLQHPLGIALAADGALLVADTYNHKIKRIDPATRRSETVLGTGTDGWRDGAEPLFDEPGGLSLIGNTLYIADTNNHVIRIANLDSGEVETLVLADPAGLLTRQPADAPFPGETVMLPAQTVRAGNGRLRLDVQLPTGYKLNDIAPFTVEIVGQGVTVGVENGRFQAVAPELPLELPLMIDADAANAQIDLTLYYCEAEAASLCTISQVRLLLPLTLSADAGSDLSLTHTVVLP